MGTFYWHDYETWGANPAVDRPCQFAGVRTDEDFNILGEPQVLYCQPPEDIWPQPQACIITGITPQHARQYGVSEYDFIRQIHAELARPNTCSVGYNSLRFDDEVTRYTLYRNFHDPYEREWRNGNSRWDIIDMVRLVYALRPQGIEWPMIDGYPSFKLENLSVANDLAHANAHDAYSDVEATIALAKLIKTTHPAVYDYVYRHKSKHDLMAFIDLIQRKPLFHISSKFPASRGCAGFIAPIAMHPRNKNAVIVFDLSADPSVLDTLSVEDIRGRIFVKSQDLPEGIERLPLKLIHLNKCPILATTKICDDMAARRLGIDKSQCDRHWKKLCQLDIEQKIQRVFSDEHFAPKSDPEQKLYDGFISGTDKSLMKNFRRACEKSQADAPFIFTDVRLQQMVLRFKARNYPELLSAQESELWSSFKAERLKNGGDGALSHVEFLDQISRLKTEFCDDANKMKTLNDLEAYSRE